MWPNSLLAQKDWDEIIVVVGGVGRVLDSCSQKYKFSLNSRWQCLSETRGAGPDDFLHVNQNSFFSALTFEKPLETS